MTWVKRPDAGGVKIPEAVKPADPFVVILDLYGNLKKKEVPPDGGRDVNVFDIQQGVAICFMVKLSRTAADCPGERRRRRHELA